MRIPERILSTGERIGGAPFTRGQIYKILSNPIYVGEINHNGKAYNGQHQAIIDRELWDAVQARLGENRLGEQRAATIKSPSLLTDKVFDEAGEPLVASHACKGKVRYRYYVSRVLQHDAGSTVDGLRIPAKELNGAVIGHLAEQLDNPLDLTSQLGLVLEPGGLAGLFRAAKELNVLVQKRRGSSVKSLIDRVTVRKDRVSISILAQSVAEALGPPVQSPDKILELEVNVRLTKTGKAVKLISGNGQALAVNIDCQVVGLLNQATEWWRMLTDDDITPAELARREGVNDSYVTRIVRLNFLAPDILQATLSGAQPAMLNATRLKAGVFTVGRKEQRELFDFTAA